MTTWNRKAALSSGAEELWYRTMLPKCDPFADAYSLRLIVEVAWGHLPAPIRPSAISIIGYDKEMNGLHSNKEIWRKKAFGWKVSVLWKEVPQTAILQTWSSHPDLEYFPVHPATKRWIAFFAPGKGWDRAPGAPSVRGLVPRMTAAEASYWILAHLMLSDPLFDYVPK